MRGLAGVLAGSESSITILTFPTLLMASKKARALLTSFLILSAERSG